MEWFHLYPFSVTSSWAKFQSDWKESQLFSDQYLFDVCILNIWLRIICGGSNRPVLKFNYFGKWGYILRFTHLYKSDTLTYVITYLHIFCVTCTYMWFAEYLSGFLFVIKRPNGIENKQFQASRAKNLATGASGQVKPGAA